ncbi:uncharacterized protein LOC127951877 [Carassius gibelio]|uniref:uncharacterized protein LOC127951877 n=1 Tax=Carassius gibelio TaxID=101364 RepID=UPI002277AD35|nr:uncharacterized protein LOC127951877 [Carassius gibelio]
MSLSAEYCSDKTGDRGGGGGVALAHQRRLIRGLLVWATLLTLGLATSITLHFIQRESPAPSKRQIQENVTQPPQPPQPPQPKEIPIMEFSPFWGDTEMVENLTWKTVREDFFKVQQQLLMNQKDGQYFLYLQVTLASHEKANHTITVETHNRKILNGRINGSKLSTLFMAKGISLAKGDNLTVTCEPKAKIRTRHTETYLGVIKINST